MNPQVLKCYRYSSTLVSNYFRLKPSLWFLLPPWVGWSHRSALYVQASVWIACTRVLSWWNENIPENRYPWFDWLEFSLIRMPSSPGYNEKYSYPPPHSDSYRISRGNPVQRWKTCAMRRIAFAPPHAPFDRLHFCLLCAALGCSRRCHRPAHHSQDNDEQ